MVVITVNKPKPRIQFPGDQLSEFKEAVSGSNLTKAGLIEVLKKRFPKVSKDIIKETLTAIAARQGQKEVDKKWVLL
ncbi:chromatin assembly factor-I (CAF-I) p90 subunit [Microsporum audouinii]